MGSRRFTWILLLAVLTLGIGHQALADLKVRYSADAGGVPTPDTTVEQQTGTIGFDGGDGSTQPSFDPENPTVQSASFILGARHGALRAASLTVLAGGQSFSATASASASASFEDMLTVDAPGLTGQNGSIEFSMVLDGLLSESLPGFETSLDHAQANVDFLLSASSSLGNPSAGVSYGESGAFDGFVVDHEVYSLNVPFVFGEPFTVRAELDTFSTVQMPNFPGSTSAISDFAQTASWQGIASVRDNLGAELLEYSVSAESSTDYRGPINIPEPATLWIFIVAWVLIASSRTSFSHRI